MTPSGAEVVRRVRGRPSISLVPSLALAAFASIGAGAIHAAAVGVHSEHREAAITFTAIAAIQIGWGVLALLVHRPPLVIAGVVANSAILAGWVVAKTSGIAFISGLESSETVQLADGIAAGLAALAVLGGVVALVRGFPERTFGASALGVVAVVSALLVLPAMVSAGGHAHADGHGDGHDSGHSEAEGHGDGDHAEHSDNVEVATASVVAPTPYDPTQPIDLGGVEGVTPEQQARAENLIAVTLLRLPAFSDPAVAKAKGFSSIGDAATGDEHYINEDYLNDGRILDPDYPESLVYQPDGSGGRKLVAAMYMAEPGTTLETVPDIGGKLTQWHVHNNLCFNKQGRVGGITRADGTCRAPLTKSAEVPMIHVWIQPHPCGPFAALEGVGAGQIAEGETRLCDEAHGGH